MLTRFLPLVIMTVFSVHVMAASIGDVVFNEIAWMGTEASTSDEWIELHNTTDLAIDVEEWSIYGADTGECINFADADGHAAWVVPAHGYLIYANHTDDVNDADGTSIVDIWDTTISMNNSSPGKLILYDGRDCTGNAIDAANQTTGDWYAGEASPEYITMERADPLSPGDDPGNWSSNDPSVTRIGKDANGEPINGTPKARNSATNVDPIANAGADQTSIVGATVYLSGAGSFDPDGDPLTYEWMLVSRPSGSGAHLSTSSDVDSTFDADLPGEYGIRLAVGDNYGGTGSDTATVIAQARPTAEFAYAPGSPTIWDEIKFSDLSTDRDGTIVAWLWTFGDGATDDAEHPAHRYRLPGTYEISLRVTDNDGLTSTAAHEVAILLGPGDLDSDGAVTVLDVRLCQEIAQGLIDPTPAQLMQADIDGDGDVDMSDADIIARYVIGM